MAIDGQGSAPPQQIAQFRSDGVTASTGLRVPFFTDDFSRSFGFPGTRLRNMITEATPLREERPYAPFVGLREVRYSRPGLVKGFTPGAGPIRALFQAPPALGGGMIAVSGGDVFDLDAGVSLGQVAGTDMARVAVSRTQVVLVAGGLAYLLDSSTGGAFAPMTSTILPPVMDVACLGGRFVYALIGSDTFYWSEINDAANIGGLSFATAEAFPDPVAALGVLNDQLMIFGTRSVETWQIGADASAPFTPVEGRGYQRGCAARDTISFADNALVWVGDNRVVYRTQDVPVRISSSSIEDRLRQCQTIDACTAFTATFEGHEFYVLNIAGVGTYAYDASRVGSQSGAYGDSFARGEWSEWTSFGRDRFRGRCALSLDGQVHVGDDSTNDVWSMETGVYRDGDDPLVRTASAFIKVEEGSPRCDSLTLHCVMGTGTPVDPGADARRGDAVQRRSGSDLRSLETGGPRRHGPLRPAHHLAAAGPDARARAAGRDPGERSGECGLFPPRAQRREAGAMTLKTFSPGLPLTGDGGRPTPCFQSWLNGLVGALNSTAALAKTAAPASLNIVANGGLQRGGPLSGDVGVALYRAVKPVAQLPTTGNAPGDWAYAVDGRKPGEAAGQGTGVPVFWSVTAWFAVTSGAQVTA